VNNHRAVTIGVNGNNDATTNSVVLTNNNAAGATTTGIASGVTRTRAGAYPISNETNGEVARNRPGGNGRATFARVNLSGSVGRSRTRDVCSRRGV
jgi:hypothetical protein